MSDQVENKENTALRYTENNKSLKEKTKYGMLWSVIERFGTQGLQFIFGIILARLLSPDDYGIIAMPLVFFAIAQCFINSGFVSALIRKPELTQEDLSTTFYFSILVGSVCYVILFMISPWIASFYNTPILEDILKVTSLTTLFTPLSMVQSVLLTRKIDFKTQAKISVISAVSSGSVGIYLAYNGYGVWSLVFQQVAGSLINVVLLWIKCNWHPSTPWSNESFQYLWSYGSKLLASSLLATIYENIYPIVIGKFYSPTELGFFTRAHQFSKLPSSNITGVMQRVTFPILSEMQQDDDRLERNYRKIIKAAGFIVFPLMAGMSCVSEPMVKVLLGEQWLGCILFLQIVCFDYLWYPIHAINLNLLQVKGRSDFFLKLEIWKKILGVSLMAIAIPQGPIWMISLGVVGSFLALIINTYYTGKLINVGFKKQIIDLLPTLLVSMTMWLVIVLINRIAINDTLLLIVDILVGGLVYILLSWIFQKEVFLSVLEMTPLKKYIKFKIND